MIRIFKINYDRNRTQAEEQESLSPLPNSEVTIIAKWIITQQDFFLKNEEEINNKNKIYWLEILVFGILRK